MRKAKSWATFIVGAYLLLGTMIYFLQEKLIFLPTRLTQDYQYQFSEPFEEIFLDAEDGARLNAIHFRRKEPLGVILYFHGNAGNLARWGEIGMSLSRSLNYDVVIMDYRTYGKSKGELSEAALQKDGQLFYDYVSKQYEESEIILYGQSLGTGIATRLASENNPRKVILETPYFSLLDIGQRRFPYLPVKWLLKYEFKSFEYVSDISCPIAVFHGTDDEIIPLESGKKLFESIPEGDKEFFLIEGAQHNNIANFDVYHMGLQSFLSPGSVEEVRR